MAFGKAAGVFRRKPGPLPPWIGSPFMWRGISLRKIGFLLFGPLVVELLCTLILLWMIFEAANMGIAERYHPLIGALCSVAYATSALIAGRRCTEAKAASYLLPSILALTLVGVSLMTISHLFGSHFWIFLIFAPLIGCCTGQYYVPFQLNMSHVRPFHTLAWSVAFYNISWGVGTTVGSSMSARLSVPVILGSVVVLFVIHTILVLLARAAPPPAVEVKQTIAYSSTPRMRLISFISLCTGALVFRGLHLSALALYAQKSGWTADQKMIAIAVLLAPVPILSPIWAKLRHFLHLPWMILAPMAGGVVGVLGLGLSESFGTALCWLAGLGAMESCLVFCGIYYCNSDPTTRAKSVGIYEALVGVTNVVGPIIMGLIAWDDARAFRVYGFGAALLGVAIPVILYLWLTSEDRRKLSRAPA